MNRPAEPQAQMSASIRPTAAQGHPPGLYLLFVTEMWERFSYYGMRALLILYLVTSTTGMEGKPEGFNPGRGWPKSDAALLYGWYTGLAYLLPLVGGLIADRLIGTHRSMLVGGLVIAMGHIMLAVSGIGELARNALGMSVFVFGLALIVMGTGHFKPTVSVMVGQLYAPGDPRRDSAFTIFYMGINLGAFLCAFVCGTLGETVGWHWGFGAAAVGMLAGLAAYLIGRPRLLAGIGLPPPGKPNVAPLFLLSSILIAALAAFVFHVGGFRTLGEWFEQLTKDGNRARLLWFSVVALVLAASAWFISIQRPEDRGPTACILIFILFNAFFWLAFEQAGSSLNLFALERTDRSVTLPAWLARAAAEPGYPLPWGWWVAAGLLLSVPATLGIRRSGGAAGLGSGGRWGRRVMRVGSLLAGTCLAAAGVLKGSGMLEPVARFAEVPATWFQSLNPLLIILLAPVFAALWSFLGRYGLNPSQPLKIAYGLLLLAAGYLFMVAAGRKAVDEVRVGMFWLTAAYTMHTLGELCLSPTGLSFLTRAAPARFVSFLMGLWFVSSFIANLGAGIVAGYVERIERGELELFWYRWGRVGGQGDFFLLFVIAPGAAGLLILLLTPLLKKMLHGRG